LQPTFDFKGEKLISREDVIQKAAEVYNFIEPRVEQDPSLIDKDNPTGNALANFYKFVQAIHWMALKDGSAMTLTRSATKSPIGITGPTPEMLWYFRPYCAARTSSRKSVIRRPTGTR
jgi:hypothetical protein